jgi:hypothetical protein
MHLHRTRRGFVVALLCFAATGCASSTSPRPRLIGEGRAVLFVGNSYLYTQDVPGLVQALADSAGGDKLAVMTIASPDYALIDHWNEDVVRRALAEHDFEWVVLQQGPSSVGLNRDTLRLATRLFADEMARAGNATPALFSAWPSEPRRQDFGRAIESYRLAAEDVSGVFLPVASGWLAAWELQPTLKLYADGLHPSSEGAYLSALVIYAQLLGQSPIGLSRTLRTRGGHTISVDESVAVTLQQAAASVTNQPVPAPD